MGSEDLTVIVGVVVATFFRYFPRVAEWYESQDTQNKQLIMLGVLVLTTLGVFGAGCAGLANTGLSCDADGAKQLLNAFLRVLVGNQSAAAILPKRQDVKDRAMVLSAARAQSRFAKR